MNRSLVSVIIPCYNEEKTIQECLSSLAKQAYKPIEIIVVDDGSYDRTLEKVKKFKVKVLNQEHHGPGNARNFGASKSEGEILVFVDADMIFDKNFIKDLTQPIISGKTIGTFSKNEFNKNKKNIWSKCWNLNRTGTVDKLTPDNMPDESPVFRAILKKEFLKVDGFSSKGEYSDDWSLSEKLNSKAKLAKRAIYYHSNPKSAQEVWRQAQWFSTNKFISGDSLRIIKSLIFYSLPISVIVGLTKTAKYQTPEFLFFRIYFDLAVWTAIFKFVFTENKSK